MANNILTISMITREAVRLWKNTNAFLRNISTEYDDQYARPGAKIGAQLRIRYPNDFTVRFGAAASVQDTNEQSTTLTLANQVGVDMGFSSVDLTLSIDDFAERFLAPAINVTAGAIAVGIMGASEGGVSNYVDNENAGAIISPIANTVLSAGAILDQNSAPELNRRLVTDPWTDARVAGTLTGLFNPAVEISEQFRSGAMRQGLGFDWMKDQTVIKHTSGTFTAGAISGANQQGTSLTTGAITGTLAAGDIIVIANVIGVNHITKQSWGTQKQFVVTANVATGATSIPIYPPLIPGGTNGSQVQYQTVVNSPASGAAIALMGPANTTYRKNIAFVPEAVTMATADLVLPRNKECAREEFDGVSMRMVTDYLIGTDQEVTRLDVLYGVLFIRPEWCVVIPDVL